MGEVASRVFRAGQLRLPRVSRVCVERAAGGTQDQWPNADHIIAKSEGGKDELGNLQTLCGGCHSAKTRRDEKK